MHALDLAPFWLRLTAGAAAAAATWVVAIGYGSALAGRLISFSTPAVRVAVGAAIGYALIGAAVALLGLVHAISVIALCVLLIGAIVLQARRILQSLRSLPEAFARARDALARTDAANRLALVVITFAMFSGLINAALPAVWWDPIAYHLPIAAAALRQGAFVFDPYMVQTGFPLLGEAAALPAYAVAGSAGAAMATLGAGLCVAVLVWSVAERMRAGSGIVAAMLVASSAVWAWLAPSFYVDVPFAMFVLAAIVVVLELAPAGRINWTAIGRVNSTATYGVVAGALSGAAAAVKYSGLGAALVVLVFALVVAGPQRAKLLTGFLFGFALFAAGWYVRSYALTGDPLYPFLSSALAHDATVRSFAIRYVDMTRHWCGGGTSLVDLLVLPYRLIAEPRIYCGDPGLALRTGALFAVVAAFGVRPAKKFVTVIVALTLLWFWSSQQWRFLLTALFLYGAIVAAGMCAIGERTRRGAFLTLSLLAAFAVLTNWVPLLESQASASITPAFAYITGRQSATEYLDARLESFAAARWLADRSIPGAQIAALDDVRTYYFPQGTSWANPYYQQALAVNWQAPRYDRYQALTSRGIKYLVVNANPAYVHRTPTGIDWSVLAADEQHGLNKLFTANDVTVYEIEVGTKVPTPQQEGTHA